MHAYILPAASEVMTAGQIKQLDRLDAIKSSITMFFAKQEQQRVIELLDAASKVGVNCWSG